MPKPPKPPNWRPMPVDITFHKSGRGKAQCPPNPEFPEGVAIEPKLPPGTRACTFLLQCPAPECGHWRIECRECGLVVAVTAAGRPDDPISIRVPCIAPKTAVS